MHAGRLGKLFDIEALPEPAAPRSLTTPPALLKAHDLCFGYDGRGDVLRNASLSLRSGEHIGIRGPSGCGKTTLAGLLVRMNDPQCGMVSLNGVDLRELALVERNCLAVVLQEDVLFSGSIRENLLYAAPNAGPAWFQRVCQDCGVDDFVAGLPAGYDTPLGERGATLSLGQKQRLCIARAVMRKPAFLVLDEATSSLDIQNELRILHAVTTGLPQSGIIIVSHRPSALGFCDRIYELFNGTLSETVVRAPSLGSARQ
jgi:ATP-binding cassette subfamily B protein